MKSLFRVTAAIERQRQLEPAQFLDEFVGPR